MPRENGFDNKRVVIVGGSSGIGLAVAEEAASQGAEVVIVSSNAERVQEAIQSIGGEARGQAVDVSDEKAVASFFTNLGAFDHLVFTAGDSLQLHELANTDLKQARRAFELRYWSALATVKYGNSQKWGSRLAPPPINLRSHPVVAMGDVRFGDRPRDYRLFEESPENEPTRD